MEISIEKPQKFNTNVRRITKEERGLQMWRKTYELVKNTKHNYLKNALRKLRMTKLLDYIKEQNKIERPRPAGVQVHKVSSIELLRNRWLEVKERGNQYSRMNKLLPPSPTKSKGNLINQQTVSKQERVIEAKKYGNMRSKLNLLKIKNTQENTRRMPYMDTLMEKRRNLMKYGTYYSTRNRLYYKESVGQFDQEYQNLLLKCIKFEKEHLEICGFLEEKFYSNPHFRRGVMSIAFKKAQPRITENSKNDGIENHALVKPPERNLTEQLFETLQDKNVEKDENKVISEKEEFSSVTRISTGSLRNLLNQNKSEMFFNTVIYESSVSNVTEPVSEKFYCTTEDEAVSNTESNIKSNQESNQDSSQDYNQDGNQESNRENHQDNKQETDETNEDENRKIIQGDNHECSSDSYIQISNAIFKNQSFEDSLLDVIQEFGITKGDNIEITTALLSRLFLTFGMNLIKAAIEEDLLRKDVNFESVKNTATKQADAVSQVLHNIFRRLNK